MCIAKQRVDSKPNDNPFKSSTTTWSITELLPLCTWSFSQQPGQHSLLYVPTDYAVVIQTCNWNVV